jgi:hypothetical protein
MDLYDFNLEYYVYIMNAITTGLNSVWQKQG